MFLMMTLPQLMLRKEVDNIKLWSGLYKRQPNERTLVNNLDVMKNTFVMRANPQVSVLDGAISRPSSDKFTPVSMPTLVNHQT